MSAIPALAGSGTFARLMPLAARKSPAWAAKVADWPMLCEKSVKSSALIVPS